MSQDKQPGADGPQAGSGDYAGTPRPDAVMPTLDEGQLAALREIGREWDQVTADPQVWREVLPVNPALGGYPKDSDFRPARFTRVVAVSGRDGQLPALETTSAAETPLTPGQRPSPADPGKAGCSQTPGPAITGLVTCQTRKAPPEPLTFPPALPAPAAEHDQLPGRGASRTPLRAPATPAGAHPGP